MEAKRRTPEDTNRPGQNRDRHAPPPLSWPTAHGHGPGGARGARSSKQHGWLAARPAGAPGAEAPSGKSGTSSAGSRAPRRRRGSGRPGGGASPRGSSRPARRSAPGHARRCAGRRRARRGPGAARCASAKRRSDRCACDQAAEPAGPPRRGREPHLVTVVRVADAAAPLRALGEQPLCGDLAEGREVRDVQATDRAEAPHVITAHLLPALGTGGLDWNVLGFHPPPPPTTTCGDRCLLEKPEESETDGALSLFGGWTGLAMPLRRCGG